MGLYLPGAGTLGCVVWPGVGIAHSQGILPVFIHHMQKWDRPFCSRRLPVAQRISGPHHVSASPTRLDEFDLLKCLVVGTLIQLDFLTVVGVICFEV